jgi:uncharacterized membrane protein
VSIALLVWLLSGSLQPARAQAADPVVRAVLFYSPTCGHCHYVITEVLPPLFDHYGGQLEMLGVDVSQLEGQAVFYAALEKYGLLDYAGVPFLVVGEKALMGSLDIPEQFPGLVEQYLAQGGVDWPDIPGLAGLLAAAEGAQAAQPSPTPQEAAQALPESSPAADPGSAPEPDPIGLTGEAEVSLADRLARDPAGNTLAIVVLIGMILVVGWSLRHFRRTPGRRLSGPALWLIPVLCVVGLGVAGYLAYVEAAQVEAVCGPVGDCNAVQQSEYARLFGILPIGVLGMAGYVMIAAAWFVGSFARRSLANYAALAMLAMTAFGTLFSVYLTFLEPFVIGATCAWCLSSAVIMTALLLLSIPPGKLAFSRFILREG